MPGATREYGVLGGIETSQISDPSTPTTSSDTVSKGFADSTYAELQYWGDAVADTTALKAIGSSNRFDGQVRLKKDSSALWRFNSASSATEDGTSVIQPTSGTGRWVISSGGGSGSGGGASSAELLQTQNQLAAIGLPTRALDNSLRANGLEVPSHVSMVGYLMEDYTSGGSSIKICWNPITVSSSDKNLDSITNWSATGQGASLAASGTSPKVGTNKFTFNKGGAGTEAGIRYDQGSQIFSCGANYRVYFWINLPSITNLSSVGLRMYADSTSNYRTWTITTDYAGNALQVGDNLCFVDLSDTTGSAATGTGWVYTTLSRYQEIILTTSTSGQTYTAIAVDFLVFSHGDIRGWAPKGLEFTAHDNSVKRNFVIDASNTRQDGPVTLGATVAQSFVAGISNANATFFKRSPATWSQAGIIGFDSTLSSGEISTQTEIRITKLLRESLSMNVGAYCDLYNQQLYRVSEITNGTTFKVIDSENQSANLLTSNEIHCFTSLPSAGEENFTLLATKTLTGNASHSSGVTTMTVASTSGMAVGDVIAKQNLSLYASVVAASASENFSLMSYDTSPNGCQLLGGKSYPLPNSIYAHWTLGGINETQALKDQTGNGRNLVKIGSPNLSDDFRGGRFALSGITTGNYLRTASSTSQFYDARSEQVQISFWVYYPGSTLGSGRTLVSAYNINGGSGQMWECRVPSGSAAISLFFFQNGSSTSTATTGSMVTGWNHVVLQMEQSVTHKIWLNGVLTSASAGVMDNPSSGMSLYWGVLSADTVNDTTIQQAATSLRLAEAMVWRNGALLAAQDILQLFSSGNPPRIGFASAVLRNEYAFNSQSGQRLSMKAVLARSTTAMVPSVLDMGLIKTG